MSKIEALDSDSSIMNNLPMGYYYYYIPYNNLEYGKFLGVCSAIESLTYNPFLNDDNDNDSIDDISKSIWNMLSIIENIK